MPDSKITALTALTSADPANDMFPIVDVSDTSMAASGTTKRISINNLLAASGTATLASATITGDLTVDTSTLKVDSANNRVIVGHTSGASAFQVSNGGAAGFEVQPTGVNSAPAILSYNRSTSAWIQLTYGASSHVFQLSGSDGMTLNSTGLGVGGSPSYQIHARKDQAAFTTVAVDNQNAIAAGTGTQFLLIDGGVNAGWFRRNRDGSGNTDIGYKDALRFRGQIAGTERTDMTLDASGNLLVGTTTNAGVRLDVQTTTGNCIGRVKSNAAASTASFIIDYVETLGCTYIKKAGSDVWIYGVQNDTSATPAFKINTASNVGVQLVSGATSWTTLSDETMKDIIEPISNAVAKVGSLRSVIGKFKTDDSSKRRSFLIAQDVQSVLPEAVDVIGENNELGLRYTEVIPLLVAAIKELTARVQTLETR